MYSCENCPVSWVVSEAYDLQPFEYGSPEWLQSARFDFSAKVPAGTTKDLFKATLQNLLADRFMLVVHRENKAMMVYEMTVLRNGPKFRESLPKEAPKEDGPPGNLQRDRDGFPILPAGTTMAAVPGHARIRSDSQTMAKYDFIVSWAYAENNGRGASAASGTPEAMDLEPYRPALINAVQSQLGLRLEEKKGQVAVLVIDHMERVPTEN
jgi:uncharacterized protein (TIGR03435 family)